MDPEEKMDLQQSPNEKSLSFLLFLLPRFMCVCVYVPVAVHAYCMLEAVLCIGHFSCAFLPHKQTAVNIQLLLNPPS